MKFQQAIKELKNGKWIYRPHWDVDTRLCIALDKRKGAYVIVKQERGQPLAFWHPTVEDLTADDWEVEVYVCLAS
ncbi:MAG TPA: DUF2829 domain-containing protein [Ruminococcus sp.]|nr:DUF2829 domain-containing protein [Ruminococcus sp.]